MNDFYTEQLVKQRATMRTWLKRFGLILVTVALFLAVFVEPLALPFSFIMLMVDAHFFKRFNLEFEYTYFNGDLDIDRIKGEESRKRVFETNMKDVEVIAPTGSIELHPYKRLKTYDYSSNTKNKTYEMITVKKGQKVKIIFEPNQEILEGMKMLAPRKVYM